MKLEPLFVAKENKLYKIEDNSLVNIEELKDLDCLIIAVAHQEFKALSNEDLAKMFKDVPNDKKIIVDVKGVRQKDELLALGYKYWRL